MCPITGIPALTSLRTWSMTRTPPSSFTACAPASFMKRVAVASAWLGPSSYEPKGRSATTSARRVLRTTARASGISSSTVIGRVES